MNFIRYIFRFLYIRNWHAGAWVLSRRRLYWFLATISVLLVSLMLIYLAQRPVVYEQTVV